ncbi:hypothetical protein A2U01_0105207, partial [Trifolium medium]|nr:hypothetical protein [Trifolium medium]
MMNLEEGVGVMGANEDYNAVEDGCRRIKEIKRVDEVAKFD